MEGKTIGVVPEITVEKANKFKRVGFVYVDKLYPTLIDFVIF